MYIRKRNISVASLLSKNDFALPHMLSLSFRIGAGRILKWLPQDVPCPS